MSSEAEALSQREAVACLGAVVLARGRRCVRSGLIHAHQVREETYVETVIDGEVETTNVAKPGDCIVTGPKSERYVLSPDDFCRRYEVAALPVPEADLRARKPVLAGAAQVELSAAAAGAVEVVAAAREAGAVGNHSWGWKKSQGSSSLDSATAQPEAALSGGPGPGGCQYRPRTDPSNHRMALPVDAALLAELGLSDPFFLTARWGQPMVVRTGDVLVVVPAPPPGPGPGPGLHGGGAGAMPVVAPCGSNRGEDDDPLVRGEDGPRDEKRARGGPRDAAGVEGCGEVYRVEGGVFALSHRWLGLATTGAADMGPPR